MLDHISKLSECWIISQSSQNAGSYLKALRMLDHISKLSECAKIPYKILCE